MISPLLWLGFSILLLAISLTVLLLVSIPAILELRRAAQSAERLFDRLHQELPETLRALRHTGKGLSSLATEVSDGLQSANHVAKQVDESLQEVRQQAHKAQLTSRGLWAGVTAAWQVLVAPAPRVQRRQRPPTPRPAKPPLIAQPTALSVPPRMPIPETESQESLSD